MARPLDPDSGADLGLGNDALRKFKKMVDDALSDLEKSPGGRAMLEQQRISQTALKSGTAKFGEADSLYARYTKVHETLKKLSRDLDDQIFSLGMAVLAADGKFGQMEEDQKARFHEIQRRLKDEARQRTQGEKYGSGERDGGGSVVPE